ncbi:ubiquilin-1-like [Tiliqua scincoides]|uniref:ubiquilin-1-like n=1 Tax=Tiliqua scincoides TaxID=71010 RepID=UPI0034618ED5
MDKDQEGATVACPVITSKPSFICVTAKSPGASAQFVLPEDSTIQEFKEELAKHFDCQTGQLVLVFFGRILKDHDTLQQCGVGDGMTVHLVIRSLKREQEELPLPPYAPRAAVCAATLPDSHVASAPFRLGSQSPWGPQETGPFGAEWQLVPTSERIIQKVRQVILANPEVQQLAQQVPAISHILNNLDIMRVILDKMREIVDLARNPDQLQDLKSPDQALMGLQSSIPGGDNPLRQLNSEIQEPGLSSGQDLFLAGPYAPLGRSPCPEQAGGLRSPGPGTEALPVSRSCTSICSHGCCADEGGLFQTLAGPLGHSSSTSNPEPSAGIGGFGAGGAQSPDAAEIPTLIVNLCNAYTKRMMFSLMQNALLASQGTEAPPEQIRQQILHFAQQMQSPEMMAAMSNPRAIQAWVQMEQGLRTLAAEAPVLVPWFALRLQGLGYSAGVPAGLRDPSCPESAASE